MTEEQIRQRNGGYLHGEAFMLMEYISEDGREIEYIWNARDGVTPMFVTSRRGTELAHRNWNRDRRIVDFVPQPGSRIFVDLTEERALDIAQRRVRDWWEHPNYPMKEQFESREEAAHALARDIIQPGAPDIKVVE